MRLRSNSSPGCPATAIQYDTLALDLLLAYVFVLHINCFSSVPLQRQSSTHSLVRCLIFTTSDFLRTSAFSATRRHYRATGRTPPRAACIKL